MNTFRPEKAAVQSYYDEYGWLPDDDAQRYRDSRYEDMRPVTAAYRARANARVREVVGQPGELLLDVASGPIQYDDYLQFSAGHRKRVCVDLSVRGLAGVRQRIGEHGLFVQADITRLPFQDNVFDGIVSLHTIFHVPADEQGQAVKELHRTLRPGRQAAVVYSWPQISSRMKEAILRSPWLRLVFERVIKPLLRRQPRTRDAGQPASPGLYFYRHPRGWFKRQFDGHFRLEVRCWRSVSVSFLRRIPGNQLGERWLQFISLLEDRWPHFWGCIGVYPLLIMHKDAERISNGG